MRPMFTGIIEEQGKVVDLIPQKNLYILKLKSDKVRRKTKPGDSVAVDGVCLTVTECHNGILAFDLMKETLEKTTLNRLPPDAALI